MSFEAQAAIAVTAVTVATVSQKALLGVVGEVVAWAALIIGAVIIGFTIPMDAPEEDACTPSR